MEWKQENPRLLVSDCGDYAVVDDAPFGFDAEYKGRPILNFGVWSVREAQEVCLKHKSGTLDKKAYEPQWYIEQQEELKLEKERAAFRNLPVWKRIFYALAYGAEARKKALTPHRKARGL